ncbi:MAG: 2-dehydro-3-deoxyphosphooctonate aldolase [Flavobacterium sp.]|nr:MAG: 2-dehydro-3-deoxyphosphooctonate aldolase [Flavobacterium sp.]
MKTRILFVLMAFAAVSCGSIKSSLKNIDDNAPIPQLTKQNTFVLTEYANDKKYGYDKDYPINVFYQNTKDENLNAQRFLNALAGPKGEKVFYKKLESCCPFPTKRDPIGAGFLDVYQITWVGLQRPFKLYLNIYEKGKMMVPVGFTAKKIN